MQDENKAGRERSPLDEDAEELSPLRYVELEVALARRTSRPLRAVLLAGTAIILVLALIPTWHYLAATQEASSSTDAQAGIAVEIASNVTTGMVSLNGHPAGAHLPVLTYLRTGQNTIMLDAPPFREQTCRITAPLGAASDTCSGLGIVPPLKGDQRFYRTAQHTFVSAYVVAFSFRLTDLPIVQQAPALAALSNVLDQQLATMSVAVPAGDHYARALAADGSPIVAVSAQALTATPVVHLSRLAGVYGCVVTVCPYIAETTFSDEPIVTSEPEWTVWLEASLGWRFSDPVDTEVGNVLFRAGLVGPTLAMTLAFSATGGWHAPPAAALTSELRGEVALDLCVDGANVFSTGASAQQNVILIGEQGGASLEGCALTMRIVPDEPGRASSTVICRFGVLMATDRATAKRLPGLPLASPDEIAASGT